MKARLHAACAAYYETEVFVLPSGAPEAPQADVPEADVPEADVPPVDAPQPE